MYFEADGSEYLSERFKQDGEKLADTRRNTTTPYAGVPAQLLFELFALLAVSQ